jgi:hypothetical protein
VKIQLIIGTTSVLLEYGYELKVALTDAFQRSAEDASRRNDVPTIRHAYTQSLKLLGQGPPMEAEHFERLFVNMKLPEFSEPHGQRPSRIIGWLKRLMHLKLRRSDAITVDILPSELHLLMAKISTLREIATGQNSAIRLNEISAITTTLAAAGLVAD